LGELIFAARVGGELEAKPRQDSRRVGHQRLRSILAISPNKDGEKKGPCRNLRADGEIPRPHNLRADIPTGIWLGIDDEAWRPRLGTEGVRAILSDAGLI